MKKKRMSSIVFGKKGKVVICVMLAWIAMVSMGRYVEPVVVVEEPRECINRLDIEGYEFITEVVGKSGEINRVILWNKAREVAKVLYGTARNNSEQQKETVVWCIINRMENRWYPNTIEEVCGQDKQWKGYDKTNPVDEDLAEIAYRVLYDYYMTGVNRSGRDYVYMSATSSDIVLRTDFNESVNTKYWRSNDGMSARGCGY